MYVVIPFGLNSETTGDIGNPCGAMLTTSEARQNIRPHDPPCPRVVGGSLVGSHRLASSLSLMAANFGNRIFSFKATGGFATPEDLMECFKKGGALSTHVRSRTQKAHMELLCFFWSREMIFYCW